MNAITYVKFIDVKFIEFIAKNPLINMEIRFFRINEAERASKIIDLSLRERKRIRH